MKNSTGLANSVFLTATIMAALFALCFGLYEYRREHNFRCDILHAKLQLNNYTWSDEDIRVTVTDTSGNVLYDSQESDIAGMDNHLRRKEIGNALHGGTGYDIKRLSETNGERYFYSATLMSPPMSAIIAGYIHERCGREMNVPDMLVVRSSVPYSQPLTESLERDYTFFYYTAGILSLIAVVLYLRYRLEYSEREKMRIKRQLTENAAHELKTPAATIEGYLETLACNPDMPEEKRIDFTERCYRQSRRMSRLLADMSMLTRLDAAEISRPDTMIDAADILRQIIEENTLRFREKGMEIYADMPERMPLHGDSTLIYSLFGNIFDNAVAYAAGATSFRINATSGYGGSGMPTLSFTFSDNGSGVPREHLIHIFERFYRLDKGRSRHLGGTGLGLAIVKNIALQYGGGASASVTPGGGLTIHIDISCN